MVEILPKNIERLDYNSESNLYITTIYSVHPMMFSITIPSIITDIKGKRHNESKKSSEVTKGKCRLNPYRALGERVISVEPLKIDRTEFLYIDQKRNG